MAVVVPIILSVSLMMVRYVLKIQGGKSKRLLLHKLFLGDNSHSIEFFDKFKNVEYDNLKFGAQVLFVYIDHNYRTIRR